MADEFKIGDVVQLKLFNPSRFVRQRLERAGLN